MTKLGLDLGSSSLGWDLNENTKHESGVITFDTGMSKGQSGGYTSPTRERREARSKRNLIQAKKYRKWELLKILITNNLVPINIIELEKWSKYKKGQFRKFPESINFLKWLACDFSYEDGLIYKNPYELRVKAIDNKLSNHEFGRVLYHLVQRRGYKDIGETDKETEKQKERRSIGGFQKALDENRTIAEALTNEFLSKNERARNQYPFRDEYRDELEIICKEQGFNVSKEGKENYDDEFVKSLWKAIIWQRPLKSKKGTIGKCSLEQTRLRCPISHPVFEIFRTWQFINTIKYFDKNNEKQSLKNTQREQLFFEIFLKNDTNFKFEIIKDFLNVKLGSIYKYNYPVDKDGKYDTSVSGMPICKGLKTIFKDDALKALSEIEKYHIGNAPKIKNNYSIYDLWHILFEFDNQHLEELGREKLSLENIIRKRKNIEVSISPLVEIKEKVLKGYADLSLKAMCKIIPFLKEGYLYNEAVVLAKIPELLGNQWGNNKIEILEIINQSSGLYNKRKTIISITNNLIDNHKGLDYDETFAYKDFSYSLTENDIKTIERACINFFGEKSWEKLLDKEKIINEVGYEYQDYFYDNKRAYRKLTTLTDIFKELLKQKKIHLNGELYHHSNRKNLFIKNLEINRKTGEKNLPKYKDTEIEILPNPQIDSIKNPMFNKSMSILRKLINELIVSGKVDAETEIVIELARELNDNNKRLAIEKYQNERRNNREKIRTFLKEFNTLENKSINIEENIPVFELWTEQIFEKTLDEKNNKVENKNRIDILKEKDAIKRYELWMEQKGQCMYTGKMISISQLFSKDTDIEHTVPRSILPDNTMANQTIAFSKYNRDIKEAKTPYYCENFSKDTRNGTSILPRLDFWKKIRDNYKWFYEKNLKPNGNEDDEAKSKRIIDKHYYKMHYDYWKDKLERFEAIEIKDSWARRQLVDTQIISKYAKEFLQLYFKKVAVQSGKVTSNFRKIYGFQEVDEIKSRNKHTHHAIDAAVLTLIPNNSSKRDEMIKKMYAYDEAYKKQFTTKPYSNFDSQKLINDIENNILIVNYKKDKLVQQSKKIIRERGKIQYVKDKQGNFILNDKDKKIIKISDGDAIRSTLFAQTYLGKIKDVERYQDGQPIRENGEWKYKSGKEEYLFVKRESIDKVKTSDKLISSIIDPVIKKIIFDQKNKSIIKDYQGNIIRHVRVRTNAGKEVKERVNYLSKLEYKNSFYSEAGSLPYAILLQKNTNGKMQYEMLPLASYEIAKMKKKLGKFNIETYVEENYKEFTDWAKDLMKIGQKVIVLKIDSEFEKRKNIEFQQKRLFVITQFSEGSIWLRYHLNALSKDEVKNSISVIKDELCRKFEKELKIPEVIENKLIEDNKTRKEDYENKRYRFDTINNSYRLKRFIEIIGEEKTKEFKKELDKYKAIPSSIEIEGGTPLLKVSKENWNFLFENKDFEISLLGKINWIE